IQHVDTAREEDACPPSSSPSGSEIQGYTISLGGDWLRPGPARKGGQRRSQGVVAARGHGRLRPAQLQGARKGLPPASSLVANRGSDSSRRGGCPLAGRLPAGKGSRRLRRGSDSGGEGERGVRASFGEKDDPAPMNLENSKDYPYCGDDSGTHDAMVGDYDAW
ncbi:hypothetical protein B296_00015289, partial [Ensete ventricosum]